MNDAAQEAQPLTTVHVTKVLEHQLSKDGQFAMVVFEIARDDVVSHFAITFDAATTNALVGTFFEIGVDFGKRGMEPGNSLISFPSNYGVAQSPEADRQAFPISPTEVLPAGAPKTVIAFDHGFPSMRQFMILSKAAVQMARDILRQDEPRLSENDRQELLLVNKRKIIRP